MASGFVSNYDDSGWDVSGNFHDASSNLINGTVYSSDLYVNTQQAGVYMMDGNPSGVPCYTYPVFCSV